MANERAQWNSRYAFMMAMMGSAIGIGNIWRFPKVLYSYGGGTFIIPYLCAFVLLGVCLSLVEYGVGNKFKSSIATIFKSIKPQFEFVAWFICIVVFLIVTYYMVIIGWDAIYFVLSFTKAWGADPNTYFSTTLLHSTNSISGIFTIVPVVITSVVVLWVAIWATVRRDLNSGIAKISNILMPLLIVMIVIIVVFSLTLPGATIGYSKIFSPDWSALTDLNVWLAAFGQILFSLGLGEGLALTYTSYLKDGNDLISTGVSVVSCNSAFEIFNAFGVFSILGFMTYSSGIPFDKLVTDGSGLAFVVFPQVLNVMGPFAYLIGPIFFLSILFAGLTSVFAMLEPLSSSLSEKFDIERKKAAGIVCLVGAVISLIFTTGAGSMLLNVFDTFLSNFGLLTATLVECLIFGWIYKFDDIVEVLNKHSRFTLGKTYKFIIKILLPLILIVLWINGVYSLITAETFTNQMIMIVLFVVIVAVPLVLTKLSPRIKAVNS